ncbi:MAG: sulfate transporter family protein, partial [Hyphomicrobiales bacterium]|nr:sulfate transporter family protein [Hyphomicrobiales bacterium]
VIGIVAGVGVLIGLAFLVAPVTALVAGLFTDEIAAVVERTHYPDDRQGSDLPITEAVADALLFAGVVILVNLVALALLLVPGVNLIAFLAGNGYLLGREYFEAAARRFRSREKARQLRRDNAGSVFIGGLIIALFLSVPLLNLLTPLFAMAMMTHAHKRLSRPAPI